MNPDSGQRYGISAACQIMKISRAAYYKWTHRKVTVHDQENQAVLAYIIDLEEKNHYVFGVKRLVTYINMETPYHARKPWPCPPNHAQGGHSGLYPRGETQS